MGDILRIYADSDKGGGKLMWTFFNLDNCLQLSQIGWSTKEEGLFSVTTPSAKMSCRTDSISDAVRWIQILQGANELKLGPLEDGPDYSRMGERQKSWQEIMTDLAPQASVIIENNSPPSPPPTSRLEKKQISEQGKELLLLSIANPATGQQQLEREKCQL
jgi:hypothetical protein